MKTTLRTTLLALGATLAISGFGLADVVSAQPAEGQEAGRQMRGMRPGGPMMGGPMRGPGGPRGDGMLLRQLDLTEAQRDQVRAINQAHRDEFRALAEKTRAAREAMRAATLAEPLDESAVRSAAAAMADTHAERALLHARMRAEVQQVLTPEQREKAKQLAAEREQRMKQRGDQMKQRMERRQQERGARQSGLWF